nr:MAG TPA: hypothetical protein [Caudoviricetes sp.]
MECYSLRISSCRTIGIFAHTPSACGMLALPAL